jgi:phosphoglycerol transferase MdoB-like AlkP superfamily enzyme
MMNKKSDISRNGGQSDQEDITSREKNTVSTASLVVLGASFIVLVVLTITLVQEFTATGENGLLTFLSGMLALAVFFLLSTLLALRFHMEKAKPTQHKEARNDTLVKHGIP